MEIRNTATEPELEWLDTPELLRQLSVSLRYVAINETDDPSRSDELVKWIQVVQRIHRLLSDRAADIGPELETTSTLTGWRMMELLEECLGWPEITPRVRELDGVRRLHRCWYCQQRECPLGSPEYLCNECLLHLIESITNRQPLEGLILFRTYNSSRWCPHADAETVMMTQDEYDFLVDGRCAKCLQEEYERRAHATAAQQA